MGACRTLLVTSGVSPACAHARATMRAESIKSFFCMTSGVSCRWVSIGVSRTIRFDPRIEHAASVKLVKLGGATLVARVTRTVVSARKRACPVRDSPLDDCTSPPRADTSRVARPKTPPRPASTLTDQRRPHFPTLNETSGAPPRPKPWERAAATGESVSASTPAAPGDAPKPWDVPGAGSTPSGAPRRTPLQKKHISAIPVIGNHPL